MWNLTNWAFQRGGKVVCKAPLSALGFRAVESHWCLFFGCVRACAGFDSVAAGVFCSVQGPVGGLFEGVGVQRVVGEYSDADAEGDGLIDVGDSYCGDSGADFLSKCDRAFDVGFRSRTMNSSPP